METFNITNLIQSRLELPKKKIDWEYQALCLDIEEFFGKEHSSVIWSLPWKVKHTEKILRDSLKICHSNKKDFKYFMGIIRNKTK